MSHFNMIVFTALVLPLTTLLNLDKAQVLDLSFWMYLLFGITALLWGIMADRWGSKSFMLLFFLGTGLSSLAAAHWIDSPSGLRIALAGIGLFAAIYHPLGLGMISRGVEQISMAMAYNGMFGILGIALCPFFTGFLNWMWGPKSAYLALGLMNLLGAGLMILLPFPESPKHEEEKTEEQGVQFSAFVILLVAMMLGGIAYRGATVILPTFLELKTQGILQAISNLGWENISGNLLAATLATFIYMVAIIGQYTGGRTAQRFDPRLSYLPFHAVTVPLAFFIAVTMNIPLVILSSSYFFFLLGMQPIENTLVARFTPRRFHHSAYGTKFVLAFGVGSLSVKLMGWIQENIGTRAIFPTLGMASLALVAVAVLLVFHTNPSREKTSL